MSLHPLHAPKGVFLTGTDTDVGKTVVTAALGMALQQTGSTVAIMKPVETGSAPDEPASDGHRLKKLFAPYTNVDVHGLYRFTPPVAPLEAARNAQQPIDVAAILDACRSLVLHHDYLLIEGAGGLLVPLTPTQDVRDLIKLLGLPCLIVSRTALGAINHTRLTLLGLRQAGIPVFGILLNDADATREEQRASTIKLIRECSDAPVLGPLPFEPRLRADTQVRPYNAQVRRGEEHGLGPCLADTQVRPYDAQVPPSQWEEGIKQLATHSTIQEVARMMRESN